MAKFVNGIEVDATDVEWGVEVMVNGEFVVIEYDAEEMARLEAAGLGGALKCREWFVTSWADAPET